MTQRCGTARQALELPTKMAQALKAEMARRGRGGVRTTGTAMVAVWLALPPATRAKLCGLVAMAEQMDQAPDEAAIREALAEVVYGPETRASDAGRTGAARDRRRRQD